MPQAHMSAAWLGSMDSTMERAGPASAVPPPPTPTAQQVRADEEEQAEHRGGRAQRLCGHNLAAGCGSTTTTFVRAGPASAVPPAPTTPAAQVRADDDDQAEQGNAKSSARAPCAHSQLCAQPGHGAQLACELGSHRRASLRHPAPSPHLSNLAQRRSASLQSARCAARARVCTHGSEGVAAGDSAVVAADETMREQHAARQAAQSMRVHEPPRKYGRLRRRPSSLVREPLASGHGHADESWPCHPELLAR